MSIKQHAPRRLSEQLPMFQIFILFLSFYVIGSLVVSIFVDLPTEVSRLLTIIDDLICVVFLFDFFYRFSRSRNKKKFMKWGWIDLVSSIPTFSILWAGQVFRIFRILRIIRAFRSTRLIIKHVFKKRAYGTFTSAAIFAVMSLIFSSLAILEVEDAPNSNIKSAGDAIWWAYSTITTVGYGDRYPVTTEGRIIAMALMTVGIGLFGTFAGLIASWFVEEKQQEELEKSRHLNK
jgi:voltage-gated potassium channel